jgi:hypothetical protein
MAAYLFLNRLHRCKKYIFLIHQKQAVYRWARGASTNGQPPGRAFTWQMLSMRPGGELLYL